MKITYIISLLFIMVTPCLSQSNYSGPSLSGAGNTRSCHKPAENKAIGICNAKQDTLTFSQLKNCKTLTVGDNPKQLITSYKLGYYKAYSSTYVVRFVSGNQLPSDLIDTIIGKGTRKITVNEIIGVEGDVNLDLGYRCFFLK